MRFKFTLRDELDFDRSTFISIIYIFCSPKLHIVDEVIRFLQPCG